MAITPHVARMLTHEEHIQFARFEGAIDKILNERLENPGGVRVQSTDLIGFGVMSIRLARALKQAYEEAGWEVTFETPDGDEIGSWIDFSPKTDA